MSIHSVRNAFRALKRRIRTVFRLVRQSGFRGLAGAIARRIATSDGSMPANALLVAPEDVIAADWSTTHPAVASPLVVKDRPLKLAWITSAPGRESGGHQNIWRFIAQAERLGHSCSVHLYDATGAGPSIGQTRSMLARSSSFDHIQAPILPWSLSEPVGIDTDAILATGWETAYPAYRDPSPARRLYFIQDLEPMFYPVGSQSVLAENTYRMGFHGITAGRWLAETVRDRYGMTADHFNFAADTSRYSVVNTAARPGLFFYARPVTPRRAFELGVLALEAFHELRPDAVIHLAGWKVSSSHLGFPYEGHASLPLDKLNTLYNSCAAGLVLSLTNMSLLPLELLASGVTTVINEGPNNRLVSDNPRLQWSAPHPMALAQALVAAYDANGMSAQATENESSIQSWSWDDSGSQFVTAIEKHLAR